MEYTTRVTKFGQCGVCKRKVNSGQRIQFKFEHGRYKCRH